MGKCSKQKIPLLAVVPQIPSSYFHNKDMTTIDVSQDDTPLITSVLFNDTISKISLPSKKFRLGFRSPKFFEVQRRQKKIGNQEIFEKGQPFPHTF